MREGECKRRRMEKNDGGKGEMREGECKRRERKKEGAGDDDEYLPTKCPIKTLFLGDDQDPM